MSNASTDTRATKLSALFSVSVTHLDAESELKKFFGSKAVSAAQASTSSTSPKRRRGVQLQSQRSQLTRPQPSWAMIKQREGLSARSLTDEETNGKVSQGPAGFGKWWTVEYGKRYKGVTRTFMQAVMTGGGCIYAPVDRFSLLSDPETLWRVLQRMPWHADTLLQLAEVYRHREGPLTSRLSDILIIPIFQNTVRRWTTSHELFMPMSVPSSGRSVSLAEIIDWILIEWRIDHSSSPSTGK